MTDIARLELDVDTRKLKQGERDLRGFEKTAGRTAREVGASMRGVGLGLTAGLTAPITAFGVGMVRATGDFEASMNNVSAISGATGGDLNKLSEVAREMGATTQFSASEAADALGFLAMAGFEAAEAAEALPDVLSLAAASGMDLAQAADIASNVLSGFGKEAGDAGQVADILAKASSSANTNVAQLGGALSTAAPIAASLGISLEETAAAIGIMSDAGIQGERAGTALRGVFASLSGPTKQARDALAEYGLAAEDVNPEAVGLSNAMKALNDAGLNTADAMTIFGREAASGALVLSDSNEKVSDLTESLQSAGGAAQEMANTRMEGFNGEMKKLSSAFESLQISIGQSGILSDLSELVGGFAGLLSSLSETNPTLLKTGVVVAGLAAAVGPLILTIGGIVSVAPAVAAGIGVIKVAMLGLLANPILLGAAAVITGIVLAWQNWDKIEAFINDVGASISSFWNDTVMPFFTDIGSAISQGISEWGEWFNSIFESLSAAGSAVIEYGASIGESVYEMGVNIIDGIVAGIKAAPGAVWQALKNVVGFGVEQVRLFLGINSPSLLFMGFGRNISEGLAVGIVEAKPAVDSAFEELATSAEGYGQRIEGTFDSMSRGVLGALRSLSGGIRGGGFLDILDGVVGALGSFNQAGIIGEVPSLSGGGYTGSGARSGGMDGKGGFLAMLHPQETVIDHTKGQRGNANDVHVTVGVDPRNGNVTAFVDNRIVASAPAVANLGAFQAQAQMARSGRRRVR